MDLQEVSCWVIVNDELLYSIQPCYDMLFFLDIFEVVTFRQLMEFLFLAVILLLTVIFNGVNVFVWGLKMVIAVLFVVANAQLGYLKVPETLVALEYIEI
jgi:hypothetical protein